KVLRMVLAGAKDHVVTRRAIDDSYVLITHNTADFRGLCGREDLHAGLVVREAWKRRRHSGCECFLRCSLRSIRAGRAPIVDDEIVEPGALYGDMVTQHARCRLGIAGNERVQYLAMLGKRLPHSSPHLELHAAKRLQTLVQLAGFLCQECVA